MENNDIRLNDKILLEKIISFNNKKFDVLLSVTEKSLLFQKKKGLVKKKYKTITMILIEDIKIIKDKVKIEQKKNKVTIYLKNDQVTFYCNNMIECKKIIEEINKLILGENFLERTSKKGIKILNFAKNTAQVVGTFALATAGTYKVIKKNKKAIKDATKTIIGIIK